jgi:NAD-dependent DNA ligase
MNKKEIIEEIKLRATAIFGYLTENESVFLSEDTSEFQYSIEVEKLVRWGGELNQHINGLKGFKYVDAMAKSVTSMTKIPLSDEEIENKETPFYKKKVVFTGNLNAFPYREEIASTIKRYGADINSSISPKTDIVIVGNGAGPSKMKKIEDLQAKGVSIQVIYEPEFLEIIEKYNIK